LTDERRRELLQFKLLLDSRPASTPESIPVYGRWPQSISP